MLQLFLVSERCSDELVEGKKVICVEFSMLILVLFRLVLAAIFSQLS